MRNVVKIIGINLFILIVLLLLLESGARLFISKNSIKPIFSDQGLRTRNRPMVEVNRTRGFALKPGYKSTIYNVNSAGFRGEELPKDIKDRFVILALGESTTFGWGVKDNQTYPYYLGEYLREFELAKMTTQRASLVINAGVPSYSSSQTLEYLKEILNGNSIKPDVILLNILWNDIWYSTIRNWDPQILISQKPSQWLQFFTKYSSLVHYILMGSNDEELVDIFNPKAMDQYVKNIISMIDISREKGVEIILVEPPFDADHVAEAGLNEFQIRYTRAFLIETGKQYLEQVRRIAKEKNISVAKHPLDIRTLHQKSLFLDALHPSPEGNAIMARDVFNRISTLYPY
jgi:lysophospholipase L1-like esterase